jgi:hypothetical protein
MKNVSEEIIIKTLIFIKENNGIISRYLFDKYITKTFLFDESFIIISKYLLEKQYIEIVREDGTINIYITEEGRRFTCSTQLETGTFSFLTTEL